MFYDSNYKHAPCHLKFSFCRNERMAVCLNDEIASLREQLNHLSKIIAGVSVHFYEYPGETHGSWHFLKI